jgi:hypothetical protein
MALFVKTPSAEFHVHFNTPGVKARSYDDEKIEGENVISELMSRKVDHIGGFHPGLGELLYLHRRSELADEDTISTDVIEHECVHTSIFSRRSTLAQINNDIRCLRQLSMKLDPDLVTYSV